MFHVVVVYYLKQSEPYVHHVHHSFARMRVCRVFSPRSPFFSWKLCAYVFELFRSIHSLGASTYCVGCGTFLVVNSKKLHVKLRVVAHSRNILCRVLSATVVVVVFITKCLWYSGCDVGEALDTAHSSQYNGNYVITARRFHHLESHSASENNPAAIDFKCVYSEMRSSSQTL